MGGTTDGVHFSISTVNARWAEMFMPLPGGSREVYQRWEEDNHVTRGPEGVYTQPGEGPGFGWDFEAEG